MDGVLRDDDTVIHAPAQLPIAPRPISTELLSSWLLRVAAANQIALCDLLDALESQYGPVLTNNPFDYAVPRAAVKALSRFCRVAPRAVRMLDLRERLPRVTSGTLLRFQNVGWYCPRHTRGRVRYSFCPSCLVEQKNPCTVGLEPILSDPLRRASETPFGGLSGMWRTRSIGVYGRRFSFQPAV